MAGLLIISIARVAIGEDSHMLSQRRLLHLCQRLHSTMTSDHHSVAYR